LLDTAMVSVRVSAQPPPPALPSYLFLPSLTKDYCPPTPTPVVYADDFEGAIGPGWSAASRDLTPSGRRFLGQFGNETVTLTLACLPAHTSVGLYFDLFIIRSWDGNTVYDYRFGDVGPDFWRLEVAGGPPIWQTTFTNWAIYGFRQAYPGVYPGGDYLAFSGAREINTLGYAFETGPDLERHEIDSVYRLSFVYPHTARLVEARFSASGLQRLEDESWGIDNLEVRVMTGP
jgi:hypothetical protein